MIDTIYQFLGIMEDELKVDDNILFLVACGFLLFSVSFVFSMFRSVIVRITERRRK